MKPEEITRERNLNIGTILGHLSRFVQAGDIMLSDIISQEHIDTIRKVVQRVGKEEGMNPIKNLCPPEVTYDEIRLVLLCLEQEHAA